MCIELLKWAKESNRSSQLQGPLAEAESLSPAAPGNNTFLPFGRHLLCVWLPCECDEIEYHSYVGIAVTIVDSIYCQSIMTIVRGRLEGEMIANTCQHSLFVYRRFV